MTLRIAYMTGEYPRATSTFIQNEVAALRKRDVQIDTISIRRAANLELVDPEQQREATRTFCVLERSPRDMLTAHARCLLRTPRSYFRALREAWSMRSPGLRAAIYQLFYFVEAGVVADYVNRQQLQHLHNHFADSSCTVAALASVIGGFSFSFTVHGPAIFYEPMRWRLDRKVQLARFVCCISDFCRSQVMAFSAPERWSDLRIVHCGVDPTLFPFLERGGDGRRLVCVGRLAPWKGFEVLIEAVADLARRDRRVQLDLIGDGPSREALEAFAARLGVAPSVRFFGYRTAEQIANHLRRADIFVSSSFAEGVPVVLMEAMASGTPVIATRIAGLPELIEDGANGLLAPPGDSRALADRIDQLLPDLSRRRQLAAAGREKVTESFNLDTEAAKLHEILLEFLNGAEERGRAHRT
jgi:colanic acid/amylovoran biosynthesis glycosyltransferase